MSKPAYLIEVSTDKPLRVYRSIAAARRKVHFYNRQCGKRAYTAEPVGHYSQPDQLAKQPNRRQMNAKKSKVKSDTKVQRETENIIRAALGVMDELPHESEGYAYAEQIRELAGKLEDYVRGE